MEHDMRQSIGGNRHTAQPKRPGKSRSWWTGKVLTSARGNAGGRRGSRSCPQATP